MRVISLRASDVVSARLLSHLRAQPEQVAFLQGFATDDRDSFLLDQIFLVTADEIELGWSHVTLGEEARRRLFSWTAQQADVLVEAHSHGVLGDPVGLSITDLDGLSEWVPHMRWRLSGRPYVALVFGQESMDGVAWVDEKRLLPVSRLDLAGGEVLESTGRSYRILNRD